VDGAADVGLLTELPLVGPSTSLGDDPLAVGLVGEVRVAAAPLFDRGRPVNASTADPSTRRAITSCTS
jgi:hypothetical protein